MKKNLRNILRFTFFLGIGVFFIWLFMRNLSLEQKREIFESFRQVNYSWIILAFVLGVLSHLLRTLRWKILMEPMGYRPKTSNVFMAVMIGYLANLALPRLGEVSRCGILTRYEKIPFNKSFGTVITERVIDMLSFVLLFLLLIVTQTGRIHTYIEQKIYSPLQEKFNFDFSGGSYFTWVAIILLATGLLAAFIIYRNFRHTAFYKKIYNLFSGLLEGIKSLTKIRKPMTFIVYSVGIWVLYLLMAWVVFYSLEETYGLGLDAGLTVLVFGSIGIMIVQGGIGIYPAIVAETLFLWDIPETKGYAMGWLIWASQTVMILIAGVFSLILLPVLNKRINDKTGTHPAQNTETA
ncbi:MAG: flippase-like domain-containing protein [Lentimicrobium sp.]|uniref:lysylphosphatidylglycerol synthase transmembrane domain-containing protein n=1 Tax=Lentimicrobium sp. TaxID=2034841 RepID=UPI0025CCC9F6|nr:lysylphosphatidylglycerol synthase transmembrane domain-containing protein [Lentimicrobium sp.]MCO5256950.1 flippase-like domain-containing protein [Lentimicrobium sp.]MCO5261914.1 flippase-like domain-containing protein [Lentimicrobium sp.]HRW70043.1 lysylphosphatidylglycerol synthase transmembrane domain-containing protein [Lentimicrobium sp.]